MDKEYAESIKATQELTRSIHLLIDAIVGLANSYLTPADDIDATPMVDMSGKRIGL